MQDFFILNIIKQYFKNLKKIKEIHDFWIRQIYRKGQRKMNFVENNLKVYLQFNFSDYVIQEIVGG